MAKPVSGRPSKLTSTQEKIALRWLTESPTHHGFETDLWTAARLGQLIREEFGIRFNPRYLSTWLRERGYTPRSRNASPASATRRRSPRGWDPTGRASKKLGWQNLIDQDLFQGLQVSHRIAAEAATQGTNGLPPLQ